jgi:hypothetical protein
MARGENRATVNALKFFWPANQPPLLRDGVAGANKRDCDPVGFN